MIALIKRDPHNKTNKIMSGSTHRKKSTLVDYSKVSDHPVQDARFAKKQSPAATTTTTTTALAVAPSAQMDAVMRLMTGREERTIAEKLADSNRPTWEQYKKDNHDKLNLDGLDQKQMDEYRQQLDAERDKRMAGGTVDKKKKKGKKSKKRKKRTRDEESSEGSSVYESSSESSDERRRRRKHKKQHKHKKDRRHASDDEENDEDRKKKRKHSKSKNKEGDDESDGDHYRLSNFFAERSDD